MQARPPIRITSGWAATDVPLRLQRAVAAGGGIGLKASPLSLLEQGRIQLPKILCGGVKQK